jgi:hypothetical protein
MLKIKLFEIYRRETWTFYLAFSESTNACYPSAIPSSQKRTTNQASLPHECSLNMEIILHRNFDKV